MQSTISNIITSKIKSEMLNIKNTNIPNIVQNFLKKFGNLQVTSLTIYRHPINELLTGMLNFVGSHSQTYDKLFHLRLYFTLENGQEFYIEKNVRINIGKGNKRKGSEIMAIIEKPNF